MAAFNQLYFLFVQRLRIGKTSYQIIYTRKLTIEQTEINKKAILICIY